MQTDNQVKPEARTECDSTGSTPARCSAAALKQQVSKILMDALQGSEPRYRLDGKYIRWGLVEKEIHQAIDAALNEKPQNAKIRRGE